ncbi:IS4 family transposase [Actinomycetospora sp. NBRC 106375]|uniref:IS4 family transposase n=1 Tax=Actinomycetospora sp. NBRC 106375 TaxID=3032207 RepID=UPI0025522BF3|nr:IS4 family transposase [Actinomycetospora sp. NBRC 106375]
MPFLVDDIADPTGDRLADRLGLGVLTRIVPRDLVDEVVEQTGRRQQRVRLLPARMIVYYVLALTLFYGDAYEEVMRKLVNGLRFLHLWRNEWSVPTTGAISKARERLGPEPLEELYFRVARPLAGPGTIGAWHRDLRVMALDGVVLDVPDTPQNDHRFGRKAHRGGVSAFPQLRMVGLAECGTHAIVAATFDSWQVYERELARGLLTRLEPDMLVLADRGFFGYEFWNEAAGTGAALLWRVNSLLRLPVLQELPDGSYLSELLPKQMKTDLHRGKRRNVPDGARVPVRVIEYTIENRTSPETIRLVTTLVDDHRHPATELAALYAQRWEFELGLDEIETHQIAHDRVLRSRRPDLVEQELWALLITHCAIRHLMHEAADDLEIDEDRLSFIRTLRVVRRSVANDPEFPPCPGP